MSLPVMDYYRAIHGATGLTNDKDRKVAEYRARFAHDFDTSINVTHSALRNGSPQDFIIVPTNEGCDLWARPGETFDIGDIIYWNTLHWLVTDIKFHDDLTRSGEMVRCNRQIRWQNQQTGEIIERWCLAKKPYTSNIKEGMVVANSDREYKIQISYDAETILVDLDRRFLLEEIAGKPKAYEVTSVDTITNRYQDAGGGFLIWNLTQHEYNPATDNAELMIADYIPVPAPPDDDTSRGGDTQDGSRAVISGRETVPSGMSRKYTVEFVDDTGPASVQPEAVWSVIAQEGSVEYHTDGNTLALQVSSHCVPSTEIVLVAADPGGVFAPAHFVVKVVDLL